MGRLSDLIESKADLLFNTSLDNKSVTQESIETDSLIGTLTKADYDIVKNSVVTIDFTNKSRRDIMIGMYGSITNPSNGKRFVIPNLTSETEDYPYEYAKKMQMLVNNPDTFTKIMNWE